MLVGCAGQTIDVFKDASALPEGAMTTASVEAIPKTETEAPLVTRSWSETTVTAESGQVTHWPIWFENAAAERGSTDGRVAVTWEDLNAAVYCPIRYYVNMAALPLSAIVDPPGTIMVSDGLPGKRPFWQRLDAKRGSAPGPDTFVPVAARPSTPPSTTPVVLPAQPIPEGVEY